MCKPKTQAPKKKARQHARRTFQRERTENAHGMIAKVSREKTPEVPMERGSVGLASSCSIHIHIHIGAVPYRTVSGDDARTRTPRTDRTHYSLHRIKRSTKPKRSPRKRPQTRRRDRRLCQNPSSSARRSWGWTLSWIRRGRCMPRRWCSMLRRFPWHSGWRSMWC